MVVVDAIRGLLLAALALLVWRGAINIPILMALALALGGADTFFRSASMSLVPALVGREQHRLERANSRLTLSDTFFQILLGLPLGGFLFTVAAWFPFLVDSVSFGGSSAVVGAIRRRPSPGALEPPPTGTRLREEIGEGLRWLWHQPMLRTLAAAVGILNLVFVAGDAIMVLYAKERLGVGAIGFGLLSTGFAVGGLVGAALAPRVGKRLGTRTVVIVAVSVMAVSQASVAATSNPYVVGAFFSLTGLSGTVWNVVTVSLRQAVVPERLLGRINSTYQLFGYGTLPFGAILGGVTASLFGLRAPFLAGAGLLALTAGWLYFTVHAPGDRGFVGEDSVGV